MAFPISPVDGQLYTNALGTQYQYVAADTAWKIVGNSGGGGSGKVSGTLNYFAKFTDSTTVGDSILFYDATTGYVGLNTFNPIAFPPSGQFDIEVPNGDHKNIVGTVNQREYFSTRTYSPSTGGINDGLRLVTDSSSINSPSIMLDANMSDSGGQNAGTPIILMRAQHAGTAVADDRMTFQIFNDSTDQVSVFGDGKTGFNTTNPGAQVAINVDNGDTKNLSLKVGTVEYVAMQTAQTSTPGNNAGLKFTAKSNSIDCVPFHMLGIHGTGSPNLPAVKISASYNGSSETPLSDGNIIFQINNGTKATDTTAHVYVTGKGQIGVDTTGPTAGVTTFVPSGDEQNFSGQILSNLLDPTTIYDYFSMRPEFIGTNGANGGLRIVGRSLYNTGITLDAKIDNPFETYPVIRLKAARTNNTPVDSTQSVYQLTNGDYIPLVTTMGNGDTTVAGFVKVEGAFGCNGLTPQAPYLVGADATDLPSALILINALKAALYNNGIVTLP
jgi:hypothetical protein